MIFLSLKQKPKRQQLLLFESIDAENQVKFSLPEMVQPEEIILKLSALIYLPLPIWPVIHCASLLVTIVTTVHFKNQLVI